MERITEDVIKAVVAIIIGIYVIFGFREFLAGIILIAVGVIIIGVNEKLKDLFLSFIKWLWEKVTSKKEYQKMESSPKGVQQQTKSGRDSYVAGRNITIEKDNSNIKQHFEDIKREVLQPIFDNLIDIYIPILEKDKEIITVRYPPPYEKGEKIQIVPFYESDNTSRFMFSNKILKKEVNETLYADIKENHFRELSKDWKDFHSQFEEYSNNWVSYSKQIFDKINDELKIPLYDMSNQSEFINTWKLSAYIVNYAYGFKKPEEIRPYENELRTSTETILKSPGLEKRGIDLIDKFKKDDSKSKELEPTRGELLTKANNLKREIDKIIKTYKLPGDCNYV